MKNLRMVILGCMFMFLSVSAASATTFEFQPDPVDLFDLDHGHYYEWGIDWTVPEGEYIVGASLFFNDIRNWNDRWNVLSVHLLDDVDSGVYEGNDTTGWYDEFFGQGLLLERYYNLPSYAQDITYDFTDSDLSTLMAYAADGNFGFGFDPDCHFYNNGVTFTIETAATPIPAPILLLGTGLIGLAGFRRKSRREQ